jgi:hypothetical protein
MKRLNSILSIGLSFLLIVSTSGIIINRHYCGDNLMEVSTSQPAKSCCTENSCCRSETTFLQVDEDFIPAGHEKQAESKKLFYFHQFTGIITNLRTQEKPKQPQEFFLPGAFSPPLQARLQVFRL